MGDKLQLANKNNLQNKAYPQGLVGKTAFKIENRNQCVKLKPLVMPKENAGNAIVSPERKISSRLNSHQLASGGKKKNPSKIPVLQKTFPSIKVKCDIAQVDTILSAADRRQKFHQSRLLVAPPGSSHNLGQIPQQIERASLFKDFFQWQSGINVNDFTLPILRANSKVVLPLIQNVNPPQDHVGNFIQVKKKCELNSKTLPMQWQYLHSSFVECSIV